MGEVVVYNVARAIVQRCFWRCVERFLVYSRFNTVIKSILGSRGQMDFVRSHCK